MPPFSPTMKGSPCVQGQDANMSSSAAPAPLPDDERFYRIGEVSQITGLKHFVLRYWEGEFPMLQPVKSTTGYRLYRQQDVDLVLKIKELLYNQGFTIAGARRHLEDLAAGTNGNGVQPPEPIPGEAAEPPTAELDRKMLLDLRDSLRAFLTLLERK
jgi:DNA-binding transcriptional MerR regulator